MATLNQNDFSGSINQNTSPFLLRDNETPLMVNCTQDESGSVGHRLGTDKLGDTVSGSAPVKGGFTHIPSAGVYTAYMVEAGNLKYLDGSTWTNQTNGASLFNSASTVEFENYLDRLYFIGSGATEYLSYITANNSSVTVVSGNIQGKYIAVGNDRIAVAGGSTYPRRVYYSNVGNDTFTTTSDYIDFDLPATAIASLGESSPFIGFDSLYMYVFDPNTGSSRKVPGTDFGCDSHRSLKVIHGTAIWVNKRGVWKYTSNMLKPEKISNLIENDLTGDALFNKISGSSFASAAAGVLKNKYMLSVGDLSATVGGETLNDCWLVYDINKDSWSARTYTVNGAGVVFFTYVDSSSNEFLLSGSRDNKAIYKVDVAGVYTDDDSTGATNAVTALYRTKHRLFAGGQSDRNYLGHEIMKQLDAIHMQIYAAASQTVKVNLDGAASYSSLSTTGATSSGSWHWVHLNPPTINEFKSISTEISGTGNWRLYFYGLDVTSTTHTGLQIR